MSEVKSSDKNKKKRGLVWWAGLLILILAVPAAYKFSFVQINVKNDARGFDGDVSKSFFVEGESSEPFFSLEEQAELSLAVQKMAEKVGLNIIFYASRTPMSDYETEIFADTGYDEMCGADTDGLFYYLDMSGKPSAYDYLSTSGRAIIYYEKCREWIFNDMDNYLPASYQVAEDGYEPYRDNIKQAIYTLLDDIEVFANHYDKHYFFHSGKTGKFVYFSGDELYVTRSRPPIHKFCLIIAGLVFGFIVSTILDFCIRKKYRFIAPTDANIYISKKDSKFTRSEDKFIRERTIKTYRSSSSGSGRSGGGGGFSGGGTHGGGGHHR